MAAVVYVGGTFDLFHYGHTRFFERIKQHFDFDCRLVLALNSDSFAASYKRAPIMREQERLEVLRACRYVDEIFLMQAHADQCGHINRVYPNYIAHGDDWQGDSLLVQLGVTKAMLEAITFEDGSHCELLYFPYTSTISSSQVCERMRNREYGSQSPQEQTQRLGKACL